MTIENKTGFKTKNDFCLYLEKIKDEQELDTYMETVLWYYENETDVEIEQLAKNFNKRLVDILTYEAQQMNLLKEKTELVSLFE